MAWEIIRKKTEEADEEDDEEDEDDGESDSFISDDFIPESQNRNQINPFLDSQAFDTLEDGLENIPTSSENKNLNSSNQGDYISNQPNYATGGMISEQSETYQLDENIQRTDPTLNSNTISGGREVNMDSWSRSNREPGTSGKNDEYYKHEAKRQEQTRDLPFQRGRGDRRNIV